MGSVIAPLLNNNTPKSWEKRVIIGTIPSFGGLGLSQTSVRGDIALGLGFQPSPWATSPQTLVWGNPARKRGDSSLSNKVK